MIYELPTRSTRRYRGKYPNRINSWSASSSRGPRAVADYLDIGKPVHIELNDGRRFIAPMIELNPQEMKLSADWVIARMPDAAIEPLGWDRYNEMLELLKAERLSGLRPNDNKPLAIAS